MSNCLLIILVIVTRNQPYYRTSLRHFFFQDLDLLQSAVISPLKKKTKQKNIKGNQTDKKQNNNKKTKNKNKNKNKNKLKPKAKPKTKTKTTTLIDFGFWQIPLSTQ